MFGNKIKMTTMMLRMGTVKFANFAVASIRWLKPLNCQAPFRTLIAMLWHNCAIGQGWAIHPCLRECPSFRLGAAQCWSATRPSCQLLEQLHLLRLPRDLHLVFLVCLRRCLYLFKLQLSIWSCFIFSGVTSFDFFREPSGTTGSHPHSASCYHSGSLFRGPPVVTSP